MQALPCKPLFLQMEPLCDGNSITFSFNSGELIFWDYEDELLLLFDLLSWMFKLNFVFKASKVLISLINLETWHRMAQHHRKLEIWTWRENGKILQADIFLHEDFVQDLQIICKKYDWWGKLEEGQSGSKKDNE